MIKNTIKNKYAAIVAAILIVSALGFSAFTSKGHLVNKHKNLSTYYWYSVNSSGQIVAGSQAYSGAKVDAAYAEDNLPCTPGNDADCVRGFNTQITSFPTSAHGDADPLKKQN